MIGSQRKHHVAAVAAAAAGAPPNQAVIDNFSWLDRLAVKITDRVGTMSFFLVIFGWTVLWVGYNVLASRVPALHLHSFDPFPAFVAYLLISNVIQIWLMPLLMVGQNMQGRHSEALDRRLLALEEAERGILRRPPAEVGPQLLANVATWSRPRSFARCIAQSALSRSSSRRFASSG